MQDVTEHAESTARVDRTPKNDEKGSHKRTIYLSSFMRYNFVTPIGNVEIPRFGIERAFRRILETPRTGHSATGSCNRNSVR